MKVEDKSKIVTSWVRLLKAAPSSFLLPVIQRHIETKQEPFLINLIIFSQPKKTNIIQQLTSELKNIWHISPDSSSFLDDSSLKAQDNQVLLIEDAPRYVNLDYFLVKIKKPIIAISNYKEWMGFLPPINWVDYVIEDKLPKEIEEKAKTLYTKYSSESFWNTYLKIASLSWLGLPFEKEFIKKDIDDLLNLGLLEEPKNGKVMLKDELLSELLLKLEYKDNIEKLSNLYKENLSLLKGANKLSLDFVISFLHRLCLKKKIRLAKRVTDALFNLDLNKLTEAWIRQEEIYKLIHLAKIYEKNLYLKDKAWELIEQMRKEKQTDNKYLRHFYAELLKDRGKIQEAEGILQKLNEEERGENLVVLHSLGKILKEEEYFKPLIERGNIHGYVELANLKIEENLFKEAEELLNEAWAIEPDNPYIHHTIGKLRIAQHDYNGAIFRLNLLLEKIDPNNIPAYVSLGCMYKERGWLRHAEKCFKKALSIDPENIHALVSYSDLLIEKQEYKDAKDKIRLILELDDNNVEALVNLAVLYRRRGEFEEALKKLQEAEKKAKKEQQKRYIFIEYAQLELNKNNIETAEQWLTEPVIMDFPLDKQFTVVKLTILAKIFAHKKDFTKARECINRALCIDNKNLQIYNTWIDIEAKASNFEEIERIFEIAKKIDSQNAYIYLSYGKALELQGRFNEALRNYKITYDLGLDTPYLRVKQRAIRFIQENNLSEVLEEIPGKIEEFFGKVLFKLDYEIDPEEGWQHLYINIKSDKDVAEQLKCLEEFDIWWLTKVNSEITKNLTIII